MDLTRFMKMLHRIWKSERNGGVYATIGGAGATHAEGQSGTDPRLPSKNSVDNVYTES